MSILAAAIDRLIEFRRSWNDGEVIDEASGLTVADLDAILGRLGEPETPIRFGIGE